MSIDQIVRDLVTREIEAVNIRAIVHDEVKRILLAGLGTTDKNAQWAGPQSAKRKTGDFPCDVEGCGFVAKSSQGLGKHKFSIHKTGGHRSYVATDEDRRAQNRVSNMSRGRGGRPTGPFKCEEPDCTRSFSKQSGLTRHGRETHASGDIEDAMTADGSNGKKIVAKCPDCDDGFASTHALRIHNMRVHKEPASEEKPTDLVECDICGESFQRNGLKRHQTMKHKFEDEVPSAMNEDAPEEGRNPTAEEAFRG